MKIRSLAAPLLIAVSLVIACKAKEPAKVQGLLGPSPLGIIDCHNTQIVPDTQDHRADIQLELDTNKCLWFGCGTWRVGLSAGTGQQAIGSLNMKGGMHLRGAGKCTVFTFIGTRNGAWAGVRMYGRDNTFENITLDTTEMVLGDEQSHVIEVVGNQTFNPDGTTPTDGNVIQGMRFNHPTVPGQLRGDCIRLLGEQAYPVTKTLIDANVFTTCKRSAIGIQRGVDDLVITGNAFTQTTDQIIDGEQSGSAINGRLVIDGNLFYATSGKYAIQISGQESADLAITDNTFVGQGLQCYQCKRFTISGNVFTHAQPGSADATIQIFQLTGPGTFTGNVAIRYPGAAAPVLSITGSTDGGVAKFPSNIVVTGNYIKQYTASVGVNVLSTQGLSISDNIVELETGVVGPHAIKVARNAGTDPLNDDVSIVGNNLRGPWQIGVTLQATARATLGHNAMPATPGAKGLSCSGTGNTGPIVSAANNWTASSCAIATGGNL